MTKGLYIIGTDTGVGKTVVSAGLMHLMLTKKRRSAYFKPIASGAVVVNGVTEATDAMFVREISGFMEHKENITPFVYQNEVAPHLAASLEKMPIRVDVIKDRLRFLKERYKWIIAEGAGGLAVPLNDEGYMQYDLIRELGFACLLVARAGLGTINHSLLTVQVARRAGLKIKGIVISGYTGSIMEKDNVRTIQRLSGIPSVINLKVLTGVDTGKRYAGNLKEVFEQSVVMDDVMTMMEEI